MKSFKELREKYRSKYPASLVAAAVKIALDMAGNMTGAYKKIENMKRGLGDDPIVKDALRQANESVNEEHKSSLAINPKTVNQSKPIFQKLAKKYGVDLEFGIGGRFPSVLQVKAKSAQASKGFYDAVGKDKKLMKLIDHVELDEAVLNELNFSYAFFDKADLNAYMLKALKLKGLTVVDSEKQAGGHYVVRVKADDKKIIAKSNSLALQAMS